MPESNCLIKVLLTVGLELTEKELGGFMQVLEVSRA